MGLLLVEFVNLGPRRNYHIITVTVGTDGALYSISSSHHTKMRRSEGQAVSRCRGGASYGPWPERKRGEVQFMHFAAQLSEADI